jgi:hypothetical protein
MNRRDFLHRLGAASLAVATLGNGNMIPWPNLLDAPDPDAGIPLDSLRNALDPNECVLLVPSDEEYTKFQNAFNLRTALQPQARVLVRSTKGVVQLVQWLKANNVPFAIRGGGHSYEGFSQSSSVVIDTRMMNEVSLDMPRETVSVGAGATLGEVYSEIGKFDLAIPAGSCPPVGVSGHTLGGGYGLLARPFGLACDNLLSVELVDATGNVLHCSDNENQDLFWALRGGGGGSFGVATRYQFRTTRVPQVIAFNVIWVLEPVKAANVFKAWQQWIAEAPEQITGFMRVTAIRKRGAVRLACSGQTVGTKRELSAELDKILIEPPRKKDITQLSFLGAMTKFAGPPKPPWPKNEKGNTSYAYGEYYMKGKSDFIYDVLSDDAMFALFSTMREHPNITAVFDGYGGAVAKIAPDATAFPHRKATASVQYVTQFDPQPLTPKFSAAMRARWESMRALYEAMAPYFTHRNGVRAAYVNYPDGDLKDYARAYWGDNLERLKKIKAAIDPDNFFQHAQSVPLA